jgi:hypothetical protein
MSRGEGYTQDYETEGAQQDYAAQDGGDAPPRYRGRRHDEGAPRGGRRGGGGGAPPPYARENAQGGDPRYPHVNVRALTLTDLFLLQRRIMNELHHRIAGQSEPRVPRAQEGGAPYARGQGRPRRERRDRREGQENVVDQAYDDYVSNGHAKQQPEKQEDVPASPAPIEKPKEEEAPKKKASRPRKKAEEAQEAEA